MKIEGGMKQLGLIRKVGLCGNTSVTSAESVGGRNSEVRSFVLIMRL